MFTSTCVNVSCSCDFRFSGQERVRAARHATFGAYRKPGKGLCVGYVKPKEGSLRHNTGAKGVVLHVGVGNGKVVTVHEVRGRWNGEAARTFYQSLQRSLGKKWFRQRAYTVLEDPQVTNQQRAWRRSGMPRSLFWRPPNAARTFPFWTTLFGRK